MPRKEKISLRNVDDTPPQWMFGEGRPETPPPPISMAFPFRQSPGGSMRIVMDDSPQVRNNMARHVTQTPGGSVRLASIGRDPSQVWNRIGGQTRKRRLDFDNCEPHRPIFSPDPVASASRPDTSVPAYSIDSPNPTLPPTDELNDEAGYDSGSEPDSDIDHVNSDAMEGMDAEIQPDQAREDVELSDRYDWSGDYATFTGRKEVFRAEAGPSTDATDPYVIFTKIWDQPTMEYIVNETNNYAWTTISEKCKVDGGVPPSSRANAWQEVTVNELYAFFGMLMLMSTCVRSSLSEYWTTGIMEIPKFRALMSRNRFCLILQYIHFCNNDHIFEHGPQRKLAKIKPLLDIINQKFSELYTPNQNISIDESLLLWKGRLSWVQCIRTKAARFGIKTYELCESASGYLYRFIVYTGKGSTEEEGAIRGFLSATSKIVLKLMDGLFDKGYCVHMDSFFNAIPLTRFLKFRNTDVVGTLNRRRVNAPGDIKRLPDNGILRGDRISRHCGDMSVVAWKDVKLVTMVSTYHPDEMQMGRRAGENIMKPVVVSDYNASMGGVDSKDQQLSMYLMERKRGLKWYIKLFKHLLNTSVLNSLIVHRHNNEEEISHRKFHFLLAEELIHRNRPVGSIVDGQARAIRDMDRLDGNDHGGYFIHPWSPRVATNRRARRQCACCKARGIRKDVPFYCIKCGVSLCIGQCFQDYHTMEIL